MGIFQSVVVFLRAFILGRAAAAFENLALRQQVAVLKQSVKRPKLRPRDRIFWVLLSRLWSNWRSALAIVQPETVIKWQRKGFKLYWRWKSKAGKPGRLRIKREICNLIRRMSRENPTWGAPRILSKLLLLGHNVAEETVAKYIVRPRKPPSQNWRTFLDNHVPDIAACDFFTVPTVTFRVLTAKPDEYGGLGDPSDGLLAEQAVLGPRRGQGEDARRVLWIFLRARRGGNQRVFASSPSRSGPGRSRVA